MSATVHIAIECDLCDYVDYTDVQVSFGSRTPEPDYRHWAAIQGHLVCPRCITNGLRATGHTDKFREFREPASIV